MKRFKRLYSASDTVPFFLLPLLAIPLLGILSGCGKGPDRGTAAATRSVTGIVTDVHATKTAHGRKIKLTFEDGVEMTLQDSEHHIVFTNTPIQIKYNNKLYIQSVSRLNPPEKDATVITDLPLRQHNGAKNPFFKWLASKGVNRST